MDTERRQLTVYANGYRIKGEGSMWPDSRVTDYMNGMTQFLALTDVEVWTRDGRRVMSRPFLNVNRGAIELVVPRESNA